MSIRKKFIGADQVDASKILLLNNTALRAISATSGNLELMKLDDQDVVQLLRATEIATTPTTENAVTNKVYVDQEISLAKAAEQSRAEAAELSLSNAIADEASRAQAAELSLSNAIAFIVENSDAAAIDSLKELLDAYTAADQSLSGAISSLASAETSRAMAAEQSLATAIADETSRAQAAESSLSTAIQNEASRAQAAEGSIQSALDAMMVEVQAFEVKTLSAQNITDGFVTVANTIVGKPVIMIDRVLLVPDQDFTITGSTITFAGDFAVGQAEGAEENDVLNIWYKHEVNGF